MVQDDILTNEYIASTMDKVTHNPLSYKKKVQWVVCVILAISKWQLNGNFFYIYAYKG